MDTTGGGSSVVGRIATGTTQTIDVVHVNQSKCIIKMLSESFSYGSKNEARMTNNNHLSHKRYPLYGTLYQVIYYLSSVLLLHQ